MSTTIYVIQSNYGGVPDEPELFLDPNEAEKRYIELAIECGADFDSAKHITNPKEAMDDLFEQMEQIAGNSDSDLRWWILELKG